MRASKSIYHPNGDANNFKTVEEFLDTLSTTYQPLDALLTALAALTTAADKYIYFSAADTPVAGNISAFVRTFLDDADAPAGRDTLLAEPRGTFYGINTQTDSYTLVLGDAGKLVEMNKATANNLTVPPQSSVTWADNTRVDLAQYGAGQTTVVAGAGVTIRSKSGNLKLTGQYSGASLYRRASDEWVLIGDLAA